MSAFSEENFLHSKKTVPSRTERTMYLTTKGWNQEMQVWVSECKQFVNFQIENDTTKDGTTLEFIAIDKEAYDAMVEHIDEQLE